MARRVALAIPGRRDQPDLGFSTKNPQQLIVGPAHWARPMLLSPGTTTSARRGNGNAGPDPRRPSPTRWLRSIVASIASNLPPVAGRQKACCRFAREAEALTIALALLQKGLFQLAGTDGTRIGGTRSPLAATAAANRRCLPPTTPSHRWQLVCSHRGCDMCRFLAATAQKKPGCLPMELRSLWMAGVALPCEGRASAGGPLV